MKKIFLTLILIISFCSLLSAENNAQTINPGKWNIYGQGYSEKSFVRLELGIEGEMNLDIKDVAEIEDEVTALTDGHEVIVRKLISEDMKAITSYDVDVEITLTGAEINVWNKHFPNELTVPILLPKEIPTEISPFTLPTITRDRISYTMSFNSNSSGTLRVSGYVDVDTLGDCEIQADCAIWSAGTQRPSLDSSTKSGCNFGSGIFTFALILFGGKKFVWH